MDLKWLTPDEESYPRQPEMGMTDSELQFLGSRKLGTKCHIQREGRWQLGDIVKGQAESK